MGTSTDSRGVSSVLATLLLTGIVAITVTASGAAYIDHSLNGSAAGHTVGQVDVSANDTTVDVVHLGGDSFDPDTLEAVLKSETDSVRVPFTDGTIDGGGDFDPASTWHYDYSDTLDGHLTKVYVVYTPKNDVLDVERFENTTESGSGNDGNVENGGGSDTGGVDAGTLVDLAVNVSDQSEHSPGNAGKSIYWVTWNATTNASTVDHVTVELTGRDSKNTGASKFYYDEQTAYTASGGLCFADGDNTHQHGNTYAINVTAYEADGNAVGYWNTTDVVDGNDPAASEVVDVDATPSGKCHAPSDSNDDGGEHGPGHAYLDLNRDGVYDDGSDVPVETSDLEDGFQNNSERLVIPENVDVHVNRGSITTDGLLVRGSVTSDGKNVGVVLNAGESKLLVDGGAIETTGKKAEVDLNGGTVTIREGSVATRGDSNIARLTVAGSSSVAIENATIETTGKKGELRISSNGAIDAGESTIRTSGDSNIASVTFDASGSLSLNNAVVETTGQKGGIDLFADGSLSALNAEITSSGKTAEVSIDAGGAVNLSRTTISTDGQKADVSLTATGSMRVTNADVTTTGKNAGIEISGNPVTGKDTAMVRASGTQASVEYN